MEPFFASHLQVSTAPQVIGAFYILGGSAHQSVRRPVRPTAMAALLFPKSIDTFFLPCLHQGRARARSLRHPARTVASNSALGRPISTGGNQGLGRAPSKVEEI